MGDEQGAKRHGAPWFAGKNLAIGCVDDAHAGSASGLFNTAMHLGIALGVVLTRASLPHDQTATARGSEVVDGFTATLPYVIGGLLITWALMFFLPRATPRAWRL